MANDKVDKEQEEAELEIELENDTLSDAEIIVKLEGIQKTLNQGEEPDMSLIDIKSQLDKITELLPDDEKKKLAKCNDKEDYLNWIKMVIAYLLSMQKKNVNDGAQSIESDDKKGASANVKSDDADGFIKRFEEYAENKGWEKGTYSAKKLKDGTIALSFPSEKDFVDFLRAEAKTGDLKVYDENKNLVAYSENGKLYDANTKKELVGNKMPNFEPKQASHQTQNKVSEEENEMNLESMAAAGDPKGQLNNCKPPNNEGKLEEVNTDAKNDTKDKDDRPQTLLS